MKLLMWHCKNFNVEITDVSDKPKDIEPEKQRSENEHMEKCIVSMITVETQDDRATLENIVKEISKFAEDTKSQNIVLMPFVHLSNNIANSKKSMESIIFLEDKLENKFKLLRSHFGYHKELMLHTFGHKTNVRFREF
jgi:threonyl-tRNA synthetase